MQKPCGPTYSVEAVGITHPDPATLTHTEEKKAIDQDALAKQGAD